MVVLCIALNTLAVSCSTEERSNEISQTSTEKNILSKLEVKNAPLDKKLEYKKYYLKEATKLINELGISSKDLISLASSYESKKQQENTFLLKDVVALAKSKNKTISAEENNKIEVLENAFKDLEERDFAISIYIPFADKLKNSQSNGTSSRIDESQHIFIFEEEDKAGQIAFEGVVLNEDGNWVTYDQLITEELAEELAEQGRMVAVIGLQDVTISDGGGNTGGGGTPPPAYGNKHFKIGNMIVRDHKETWIAGASEITTQMYKLENGNLQKINLINSSTAGGNSENIFTEFKRKEIKNQTQKYLNANLGGMINSDPSILPSTKLFYVIYEADNWPVTTREVHYPYSQNGQQLKITFGSSDGEYYNSNENNNVIPYVADNGSIKFYPFLQ